VVREFTKLALSGIQTGAVNQKMYSKAAGIIILCSLMYLDLHTTYSVQICFSESLELDADAVKKSIEGIVAIFLECSKRFVILYIGTFLIKMQILFLLFYAFFRRATSKEDFELSLLDLRFNAESQQILCEVSQSTFLSSSACLSAN
jgi:hypothetical protein